MIADKCTPSSSIIAHTDGAIFFCKPEIIISCFQPTITCVFCMAFPHFLTIIEQTQVSYCYLVGFGVLCVTLKQCAMSRTNIRILKTNSNFIEIRFVSEASAVRHGPRINYNCPYALLVPYSYDVFKRH